MVTAEVPSARKARGAFYTPLSVARFLVDWAIDSDTQRILEPSTGDGVFLEAIAARVAELGSSAEIVGVELMASEAEVAQARAKQSGLDVTMRVGDFFGMATWEMGTYDAIVGNPPWIRYHGFNGAQRASALRRAADSGVMLSGLTSSWAPYLVHALSLLRVDGRLAMVLPGELLQVDYAADVRRYLTERFASVQMISFRSHQFGDAEVDAVLLLASQEGPTGVWYERVERLDEVGQGATEVTGISRWAGAVASPESLAILADLEATGDYVRLGSLGSVDIGVVTGFNDYFLLSDQEAAEYGIPRSDLRPVVSRSDQLLEGIVSTASFERWRAEQRKVWLLALGRGDGTSASRYLEEGSRLGVPNRYKCRTRRPWFSVPLKPPPDVFLSYMAHEMPRIAINELHALSTNLVHGIYLDDPATASHLAATWSNPATALSVELEGRMYGGGVLKLETKEAERVLVPAERGRELTDEETSVLREAVATRRRDRMRRPRSRASEVATAVVHS